jgi:tetratricopeptide (TPR) repeat protein
MRRPSAYADRACLKHRLKDYKGAIADYTIAIKIKSNNAADLWNRGNVKKDFEDYKGAIADYNKSMEKDPDYAFLCFQCIGAIKFNLQDYEGAIETFTKELEDYPKSKFAYYNRGMCKMALGQKESAFLDFNKAVELGTAKVQTYFKESKRLKESLEKDVYEEFLAQL